MSPEETKESLKSLIRHNSLENHDPKILLFLFRQLADLRNSTVNDILYFIVTNRQSLGTLSSDLFTEIQAEIKVEKVHNS